MGVPKADDFGIRVLPDEFVEFGFGKLVKRDGFKFLFKDFLEYFELRGAIGGIKKEKGGMNEEFLEDQIGHGLAEEFFEFRMVLNVGGDGLDFFFVGEVFLDFYKVGKDDAAAPGKI